MIRRALLHVAGPPGVGKTTFIERFLERELALAICVRAEQDPELRREQETAPKRHSELRRYRESGASDAVLYRFPRPDADAFYDSDVMADYSEAVVVEGDCPVEVVDLSIFVAPSPRPGELLLRRALRDRSAEHRASIQRYATALESRESLASSLAQEMGEPLATIALGRPEMLDDMLGAMREGLEKARRGHPPEATEHWVLGDRYRGLERAQLVIVSLRPEDDPERAHELCAEIPRLRKDQDVFDDLIGPLGNRVPITAVVADLREPSDVGLRKCFARVRRTLRSVSE